MSYLRQRLHRRLRGPGAWRTWLGLVLLTALAGYAFYAVLWKELPNLNLAELFRRLGADDVLFAFAGYTIALIVAVAGWAAIMGSFSNFRHLPSHAGIYLFTNITRRLPGTFWYLLGRVVLYERVGVPRAVTALAGGVEFAATIVGGLVVALAAWPLVLQTTSLNPFWLLLPLFSGIALLNPPVLRALLRRFAPAQAATVRYRHMLAWILTFALVWCSGGVLLFALVNAVAPQPLSALPAIIGVWATSGIAAMLLFSFVPFGLGVTELTLATLLAPFLPTTEALFVALVLRALATLWEVAYAVIGLLITTLSFRYVNNTFGLLPPDFTDSNGEKPETEVGCR